MVSTTNVKKKINFKINIGINLKFKTIINCKFKLGNQALGLLKIFEFNIKYSKTVRADCFKKKFFFSQTQSIEF
jgi:hypothetical protein